MSDSYFDPRTLEEHDSTGFVLGSLTKAERALEAALDAPLGSGRGAATYRENKIRKIRKKVTLAEARVRMAVEFPRYWLDQHNGHKGWFGVANAWSPAAPPRDIDWRACEHIAAEHLRALGFEDAEVTPARGDAGIDVRSEIAVAQVKHQKTAVGRPALQNLVGAAVPAPRDDVKPERFFYSTSGYTQTAVRYAEMNDIYLYVINPGTGYVSRVPEITVH